MSQMASFFKNQPLITLFLLLVLLSFTTTTSSSTTFHPKTLLLKVSKHPNTSQYTTQLLQQTPPILLSLTLDLINPFLWVVCNTTHSSSSTTFHPLPCNNNNTCTTLSITNPITHTSLSNPTHLATDVIQINSTDGSTTRRLVTLPNFLFACAPVSFLHGLPNGVSGIAALGRSPSSLPSQSSSALKSPHKFALCLSPSPENGAVFLGDGPYNYNPAGTGTVVDLRTKLSFTPLLASPVFTSEYFIQVESIKIGEKKIPINKSLLTLNKIGHGGTTISLVNPYTILETSIFKAITSEFDKQMKTYGFEPFPKRVAPVAPFEFCYDTILSIRGLPEAPLIRLVFQSEKVVWTVSALNSVVSMGDGGGSPYCFGFVDGGKNPRTAIVIGGYQIEDNFLEFDLVKSRLGFSSDLAGDRIRCSLFNFTTSGN